MTSILKQENGELFLYRSGKEFPKREDYQNIHVYYSDRANWFSTAERIKVAEGERVRFIALVNRQFQKRGKLGVLDTDIEHGCEIPSDCYEVRRGDMLFPEDSLKLAYFKEPLADKKETDYSMSNDFKKACHELVKQMNSNPNPTHKVWMPKSKNRPQDNPSPSKEELWDLVYEHISEGRPRKDLLKMFSLTQIV